MGVPVFEFVPFGRRLAQDPYPTYARMREAGDVLRTSYGALVVHRHAQVRRLHADHDGFSMSALGGMGSMLVDGGGPSLLDSGTMLTTDPPDHERLRRVVTKAFTPRSIASLEEGIRAATRRMLAPLAAGEPFELVGGLAGPLPTAVIASLLGIPEEDGQRFRAWTEVVTGTGGSGLPDPAASQRAAAELGAYLAAAVDERRTSPTDDLIGRMVVAGQEDVMSDEEVVASCLLLLLAGNETTMRLVTNLVLALGRHPEQLERVAADRSLVPSAVEEALRFDSPVQLLPRAARRDATIGDVAVAAGTIVLSIVGAANRDPGAYPGPDRFDVGRFAAGSGAAPHVAFGHGIHHCLGAVLARLEARVALEELLEAAPRFRVLTPDEELDYPRMAMLRSPRALAVQRTA